MKLEVMDGGISGKIDDLIELIKRFEKAEGKRIDLTNVQDRYAFILKYVIQYRIASKLPKDLPIFRPFNNELHESEDITPEIRPTCEVYLNMLMWDGEEPLTKLEKELFFYSFAEEIAVFHFSQTSKEPRERLEAMIPFRFKHELMLGLMEAYCGDYMTFGSHHDFFYQLAQEKKSNLHNITRMKPEADVRFFSNAWVLWYNCVLKSIFIDRNLNYSNAMGAAANLDIDRRNVEGLSLKVGRIEKAVSDAEGLNKGNFYVLQPKKEE